MAPKNPPVDLAKLRPARRSPSQTLPRVAGAVFALIIALCVGFVWVNRDPTAASSSNNPASVAATTAAQDDAAPQAKKPKAAPRGFLSVVETFPHDPDAFTQGLCFHEGRLFESTGELGKSTVREVDLTTGEVLRQWKFPDDQFGEGMTIVGDRVYTLTWQSNIGHVLNLEDFSPIRTFPLPTEGWGLTHGPNSLIMSDGSSRLYFLDPESLEVIRSLEVVGPHPSTGEDVRIDQLNELEYINGSIWANIWLQNLVVVISPKTGRVSRYLQIDPMATRPGTQDHNAVANGIAYDARTGSLYLTGKRWPALYRVEERGWEETLALWKGRRYQQAKGQPSRVAAATTKPQDQKPSSQGPQSAATATAPRDGTAAEERVDQTAAMTAALTRAAETASSASSAAATAAPSST